MASPTDTAPSLEWRLKQSANDPLATLTKRENQLWRELKTVVDSLKTQMARVKTEGVRENVDRILSLLTSIGKIRDDVTSEWRNKLEVAGRSTVEAQNKMVDRVETMEGKVMDVLGLVQTKLSEHDSALSKLALAGQGTISPYHSRRKHRNGRMC